jgi:hypothetical protein
VSPTFEGADIATMRGSATMVANADSRTSLVGHLLRASAIFVRRARAIEASAQFSDDLRTEHFGLVSAVVMQSSAALETESHEICTYGPGSYLGTGGIDEAAREFLEPLADIIDRQNTVRRFDVILHVLRRAPLDPQSSTYRNAALLARLRNELVHYKSEWTSDTDSSKLYRSLQQLRHVPPPFTSAETAFFPGRCLSADCAAWALQSTVAFLESVYAALGVRSRFESYGSSLSL